MHAFFIAPNQSSGLRDGGFTLPTVVISSIVMLTIGLLSFQISISSANALRNQYHQQLSSTAAESGVARAVECIDNNGGVAAWTSIKPLTTATDCAGNIRAECSGSTPAASCYVVYSDSILTSYSIGSTYAAPGSGYGLTAVGSVDLVMPGGAGVSRVARGSAGYLSAVTNLPKITGGAGWSTADHLAAIVAVDDKLYGVGSNISGHITEVHGSPPYVATPMEIKLPTGVSSVKKVKTSGQGAAYICILGSDDSVYCRGNVFSSYWTKITHTAGPSAKVYDLVVNGYGEDSICILAGDTPASKQAYCGGFNDYGLLGKGSSGAVPYGGPYQLFNLGGTLTAKEVHSGGVNTCVIASNDDLYCAGLSSSRQISGYSTTSNYSPIKYHIPSIGGLAGKAKSMLSGYHSQHNLYVLDTRGIIWVSGKRTDGVTGNGNNVGSTPTAEVFGMYPGDTTKAYATGGEIRLSSNEIYCVEDNSFAGFPVGTYQCNNTYSQKWFFLDGDSQAIWHPSSGKCLDLSGGDINNSTGIQLYSCNGSNAQRWVHRTDDSTIRYAANQNYCLRMEGSAGNNKQIQLRECSTASSQKFTRAAQTYPWKSIIVGTLSVCGVREDGGPGIWCAGQNIHGQLANRGLATNDGASCTSSSDAIRMSLPAGVKVDISKLSSEWQQQFNALQVIGDDGQVYGAGSNNYGRLGNGSASSTQCTTVKYNLPPGVKAVDMSTRDEYSTYVLGEDGNVYSAGLNNMGQLGDGTMISRSTPVKMKLNRAGVIY